MRLVFKKQRPQKETIVDQADLADLENDLNESYEGESLQCRFYHSI